MRTGRFSLITEKIKNNKDISRMMEVVDGKKGS